MSRTARSFHLIRASWSLLGRDPKLLLLPLGALVSTAMVAGAFAAAGLFHGLITEHPGVTGYASLYAFYAISSFIGICFNATLVAVALRRLEGEPATIADGWAIVRGRLPQIVRWALLVATIGVVLRVIEERAGIVGRVVGIVGSVAWGLVTFFVVPVLLVEDVDVRAAIRRSAGIFRQRWGEQLVANVALGIGLLVVLLPVMLVGAILILFMPLVGVATVALAFLALLCFSSALGEVFNAALYRYAVDGSVPPGFTRDDFESAVKQRRGWRRAGGAIPPRPDR